MSAMRSTPVSWTPRRIADAIKPFTPGTQLARVFRYHQEIQDARGMTAAGPGLLRRFNVNILLLTSEFAPAMGGIGTYAGEIASAATRLGARVTVVAPDYARSGAMDDSSLPFEVIRFRGGLHSMRDLPSKIMLARDKVRRGRLDVVHAADWPFFIPVALSRWRTQARMLMTVHGTEINETQTPLKRLAIRGAGVFGPRTQVVANSRYTEELFRQRFGVEARRVSAVRLGVSDFWFGARRSRAALREALQLAPDRLVIVTVARITRRKGHHLTLAALSSLPDDVRRRVTWLVVGPNGEAEYVESFRRLAEASDCDIRMLGPQPNEQIRDIYGAADFFCLTGQPDASGRVEGFRTGLSRSRSRRPALHCHRDRRRA